MATRALPGSTIGSSADKKASRDGTGIQGVFFDLGGTLYSYEGRSADHQRLLEQAVRQMGLKLTVDEIGDAHSRASLKVAHAYADKEYYLHAELFRDMFIQFCTEAGGEFDFALWQSYQPGYDAAVMAALKLRDDCRSTLVELRERGYYTAIASNMKKRSLASPKGCFLTARKTSLGWMLATFCLSVIRQNTIFKAVTRRVCALR